MQTKEPRSTLAVIAGWVTLGAATAIPAQTPNAAQGTAPSARPAAEKETVTLSPFTINASKDQGYVANSTLSGSRLNSSLRDTPMSVSVLTSEFLKDLGANNLNEAIDFATNAQNERADGTGNHYEFSSFSYRIRGFGGTVARNYFGNAVLPDTFSVDRVDVSRGPQALLTGIGNPGGYINSTTKMARLGAEITGFEMQVGDWDHYRATADISRTLIKDVLAFRINALWQEADFWRDWGFDNRTGVSLAGTFRPYKQTTLRVEYERGRVDQNRVRPWAGINWYHGWRDVGSPLSATWGVRPAGTTNNSAINLGANFGNVIFPGSPYGDNPVNLANFWVSTSPRQGILSNPQNIRDESIHPREANIQGPGATQEWDYQVIGVFLEQQVSKEFFVEAAIYRQTEDRFSARPIEFGDLGLRVDLNQFLPVFDSNGAQTGTQRNPNVGRYLTRAWFNDDLYERVNTDARLVANYNIVLGGFGRHRLAAMAQSTENEQKNDRRREVNRSPTRRNANLGNATNRVYRLTYLDLVSGPPQERGVHTRADHPGNARSVLGAPGFGFEPGLYSYGKTDTSSQLASYIVALQSSFLGERLVTTLGNRWDNLKEYGSTQRTDPATSEVLSATRNAKPNLDTWESTPSVGAVVHVTPRLSVFGSLSEIFRPQTGQDIFSEVSAPKPAGNITGEGRDLGVRYSLAESKLSVALNYFSTSQDNVRSFWSGSWVVDPINAIWATLGSNRTLFPNIPDVLSQEVQGYEFEAVANPLPGLRVSANAARNDLVTSNRFPNMIQYVADNRSAWLASRSTPMTNTAYGSTVADAVAFVDVIRDRESDFWGRQPQKHREWTANAFARYQFQGGPGKGLFVGLGFNYRGPMVIGHDLSGNRLTDFEQWLWNASMGYTFRLGQKTRLMLQLNIDNLLDEDDWFPVNVEYRAADKAFEYNWQMPDPRRFRLTARFSF